MKLNNFCFIIIFTIISICSCELSLVWSDEFDEKFNCSKWDIEVNCWGGGNNEKQCYVNSQSNIYIQNGHLHIKPIIGKYQGSLENCTLNNEDSCTWIQEATSGRIRTLKSTDGHWTYGKFEIRAKLPKGDFLWPAIWMLPTDNEYGGWAASGEIDIMEFRGQDRDSISHSIRFGGVWPNQKYKSSGVIKHDVDFTEDFHVFGFEWTNDDLIWSIDGKETYRETLHQSFGDYGANGKPFDKRFHLIINLAVAGDFFDSEKYGTFDPERDGATWTQPFIIDYVRVYQEKSDNNDINEPSSSVPLGNIFYHILFIFLIFYI